MESDTQNSLSQATELRPWGSFSILDEGIGYKIKKTTIKPGHSLSLQIHHHRSEHYIVISGVIKVTQGDEEVLLNNNESIYIPRFTLHRLENPGMVPANIIEVHNGEYLGEDDIVRYDDDYYRTNTH